jgi:AraC-like DNA-binding protein
MSSRLDRITDWQAEAVQCGFQLEKLARACGVSERTLRRYFQRKFGVTPKHWRDARRLEMAFLGLLAGEQVKATASNLKFKHREALSAFIKRQTGSPPRDFRRPK